MKHNTFNIRFWTFAFGRQWSSNWYQAKEPGP